MGMKATNWEFANRAMVFGLMFAVTFPLYGIVHENAAWALANWIEPRVQVDATLLARLIFAVAALLLFLAALLRTWASSYLQAGVVYASEVKTEALVADGPYRRVRNPLYLANVLMGIGMGAMMSRLGFAAVVVLMVMFCYRLIFREEAELRASQGAAYEKYCAAVPRMWPALTARVAASGRAAKWGDGFKAESWYWGFGLAVAAFAATLKLPVFFAIFGGALVLFWALSARMEKKAGAKASTDKGE
jgi:protein-S-isoprenylcysteine O-methyltransferase Ste14